MAKQSKASKAVAAKAKTPKVLTVAAMPKQSRFVFDGDEFFAMISQIEQLPKTVTSTIDYALRCAALHHAYYGNTTPLNRVFQATKQIVHKNTVALWIAKHCPVTYDKKEDTFNHSDVKFKLVKDDLQDFEDHIASAPAYYDMAKPDADPFKGFDLIETLKRALKQAEAMQEAKTSGVLKRKSEERALTEEERDAILIPATELMMLKRIVGAVNVTTPSVH